MRNEKTIMTLHTLINQQNNRRTEEGKNKKNNDLLGIEHGTSRSPV